MKRKPKKLTRSQENDLLFCGKCGKSLRAISSQSLLRVLTEDYPVGRCEKGGNHVLRRRER